MSKVVKPGEKPTAEQKADMARMEQLQVQKNNAAVDQLQSVADRFNEQVRIYKAKTNPASDSSSSKKKG